MIYLSVLYFRRCDPEHRSGRRMLRKPT